MFSANIFYNFMLNPLIIIFFAIIFIFCILFLIRNIICWYLKINKIIKNQNEIISQLKKFSNNSSYEVKITSQKNQENQENKFSENDKKIFLDEKVSIKDFSLENVKPNYDLTDPEKEIFQNCKNITFYETKNNLQNQNIYTYFRAKQYNIILVGRKIENFKSSDNLISIEEKLDLVVFVEIKDTSQEELKEKVNKFIKECIARKKIKFDIKYIWIENFCEDYKKEIFTDSLTDIGIKFIIGKNFYKEYVKKILKK